MYIYIYIHVTVYYTCIIIRPSLRGHTSQTANSWLQDAFRTAWIVAPSGAGQGITYVSTLLVCECGQESSDFWIAAAIWRVRSDYMSLAFAQRPLAMGFRQVDAPWMQKGIRSEYNPLDKRPHMPPPPVPIRASPCRAFLGGGNRRSDLCEKKKHIILMIIMIITNKQIIVVILIILDMLFLKQWGGLRRIKCGRVRFSRGN